MKLLVGEIYELRDNCGTVLVCHAQSETVLAPVGYLGDLLPGKIDVSKMNPRRVTVSRCYTSVEDETDEVLHVQD